MNDNDNDTDDNMSIEEIEFGDDNYDYDNDNDNSIKTPTKYNTHYFSRIVKLDDTHDIDKELASLMNRSFNVDEEITILKKHMTYLEEIFYPVSLAKFEDVSLQSDKFYYYQMMELFHSKNKQYLDQIEFDIEIPIEKNLKHSLKSTIQYYEENFDAMFKHEVFFVQKQYLLFSYSLYKAILEYIHRHDCDGTKG